MDYPIFDDPNTARDAIEEYSKTEDFGKLDADTKAHITECLEGDSVSFCSAYVAEWVYARMDTVVYPQSLISLAASVAAYALKYSVDNIRGDRGHGMVEALRRERGEPHPISGAAWPHPDADPAPRENYMVAPPSPPKAPPSAMALTPAMPAPEIVPPPMDLGEIH